jgi:transcription initiation factor TFIID subunit 10
VKRIFALAAQKFIMDVVQDAYQYNKIRQQGMSAKDKRLAGKKSVLTMDDLSAALSEYGIHVRRPEYYS